MSYYMGVDIGTSSVKSMLISGDGNVAGTEQVGYNIIKERLPGRNRTWKNFGRLHARRLQLW